MAPDVAGLQRLEEHALTVDPKAIESEFDRIWQETVGPGGDDSTIRVRVMNLVAIAAAQPADERFETLMQRLPERHPCRGFLVATAIEHDRLGAVISAHCVRGTGARVHVCSEEVALTGAPTQHRELASAVRALLVPDLPVVLWLTDQAAAASQLAERLFDAADAVILDSVQWGDPSAAFQLASRLREEYALVRYDLAWGRLSAWRALTAQIFDGADGMREMDQIRSIEIRARDGSRSSEALLFASWLTTRTGLALADAQSREDRLDASYYDGTREVRLSVSPDDSSGGIGQLRIRTSDAEFMIERHRQSGHMHVVENWDSGSARRIVEAASTDEASVIELALDGGMSPGAVYEEALQMAMALTA